MKHYGAFLFLIVLAGMTTQSYKAQDKPLVAAPKPDDVTLIHSADSEHIQLLYEKEKNLNMQFQLMQKQIQEQQATLQSQYSTLEKQITDWVAKVKKDNDLGDDVQYDRENDKWVKTPKAPPPAAKPAEPAKK